MADSPRTAKDTRSKGVRHDYFEDIAYSNSARGIQPKCGAPLESDEAKRRVLFGLQISGWIPKVRRGVFISDEEYTSEMEGALWGDAKVPRSCPGGAFITDLQAPGYSRQLQPRKMVAEAARACSKRKSGVEILANMQQE